MIEIIEIIKTFDVYQWMIVSGAVATMCFYKVAWFRWTMCLGFFVFCMSHVIEEFYTLSVLLIIAFKTLEFVYKKVEAFIKKRVKGETIAHPASTA